MPPHAGQELKLSADWLNALTRYTFLQVKLVSIDAADVADGNASIILGLIWNIILFFQVTFLQFFILPVILEMVCFRTGVP